MTVFQSDVFNAGFFIKSLYGCLNQKEYFTADKR